MNILVSLLCLSSKIPPSRSSDLVEMAGLVSVQVTDVSSSLRLMPEDRRKSLLKAQLVTGNRSRIRHGLRSSLRALEPCLWKAIVESRMRSHLGRALLRKKGLSESPLS